MSRKTKLIVIILLFLINSNIGYAKLNKDSNLTRVVKDDETYLIEDYRRFESLSGPTVAVALTGGGATAFFNIGVIKSLEEEGIPIDLIVGTSMGSIVGTM